jgi:hypothetical protein
MNDGSSTQRGTDSRRPGLPDSRVAAIFRGHGGIGRCSIKKNLCGQNVLYLYIDGVCVRTKEALGSTRVTQDLPNSKSRPRAGEHTECCGYRASVSLRSWFGPFLFALHCFTWLLLFGPTSKPTIVHVPAVVDTWRSRLSHVPSIVRPSLVRE